MSDWTDCVAVLSEVGDERTRQDKKWGQQNHPDGTGSTAFSWVAIVDLVENRSIDNDDAASAARFSCDFNFRGGRGTWADILLEEVAEAYAEDDPDRLRAELVQVAAVAVAWVEAIDRRGGAA